MKRSASAAEQHRYIQIYVYEWPVRLWHGINAVCMLVLTISGFLIASPSWPTFDGEASDHFVMGYNRFAHFSAGYLFAIALIGRVYWSFVGNQWARELFRLPLCNRQWWADLSWQCRWYAFRVSAPRQHIGHDPLAQLVMFALFTLPSAFMIVSGFALYSEGQGSGSWPDILLGWVIPMLGQSQGLHTWHHLGMWVLIAFTIIHVYAAIREELMSNRSLVSTMISGYRVFRHRGVKDSAAE